MFTGKFFLEPHPSVIFEIAVNGLRATEPLLVRASASKPLGVFFHQSGDAEILGEAFPANMPQTHEGHMFNVTPDFFGCAVAASEITGKENGVPVRRIDLTTASLSRFAHKLSK